MTHATVGSISPRPTSRRWPPAFPRTGVVVAESLRRVPGFALPGPGELCPRPTRLVAGAIAAALAPIRAADPAPDWLRRSQVPAFQRALAALRRWGGALLAEPAGTGKTWIALAAARALGTPAACVVPAGLREQWQAAARTAGVPITLTTHEQWSRGRRDLGPGLVVIDESHRFRSAGLRRATHLAPALVGRQGILLTATPVVNRLDDLTRQLLLVVPDDLLGPSGVPSLEQSLRRGEVPAALAEVIVTGTVPLEERPGISRRRVRAGPRPQRDLARLLDELDGLELSRHPTIALLVRGVLTTALGSSVPALIEALTRYRALLLQAREAGQAGGGNGDGTPARRELRRLLGGQLDQLVLWELLPSGLGGEGGGDHELALGDLPALDLLIASAGRALGRGDPKADRLQRLIEDGKPTLVFTGARATVDHLRSRLRPTSRIAWCTGEAAGIGPARVSRRGVLSWFRPGLGPRADLAPRVLVATDVAAEGLDLQRAARIVHYDLPWSPMRLDQRVGRARRMGAGHREIEVVHFEVPALLERRLRLMEALARKSGLPARVGTGPRPDPALTWRIRIAEALGGDGLPGAAAAGSETFRLLAGVRLLAGGRELGTMALARTRPGRWTMRPEAVEAALRCALARPEPGPPGAGEVARACGALDRALRPTLRGISGAVWGWRALAPTVRLALQRVRALGAEALRRRDGPMLSRVDRALTFLRGGHTLGERALVAAVATCPAAELPDLLGRLPARAGLAPPIRVELTGLVLFRPPVLPRAADSPVA